VSHVTLRRRPAPGPSPPPYATLFRSGEPDARADQGSLQYGTPARLPRAGIEPGAYGGPARRRTGPGSVPDPGRDPHLVARPRRRSEEHTSELQSRENLVGRLLLAKTQ